MRLRTVTAVGCVLLALAGGTPAFAQAVLETSERGRLADGRLTLFIAYAPRFTRTENRQLLLESGSRHGDFEVRNGPGRGAGAAFEMRAFDGVRVATSFAWIGRSSPSYPSLVDDTEDARPADVLLSRVSVAVRLEESTSALQRRNLYTSLHAGPAYVLEIPRAPAPAGTPLRAMGSWGFSAGFDAEAAIGSRVVLHAGAEDYVVYWNEDELGRRHDEAFAAQGLRTATIVRANASHAWLLRFGVAFILR